MLTRFTVGKAPFDSVSVSYYKPNKKVNESSELSKSNKDDYHNLLMVLIDLFDEWGIVSYSDERFGDDELEHKFWAFRILESHDVFMTGDVDSGEDVKDIVVYNIPSEESERFFNDLMSCKEQIEGLTGRRFEVKKEIINNLYIDYILRLN
jgi:hypothetical protein